MVQTLNMIDYNTLPRIISLHYTLMNNSSRRIPTTNHILIIVLSCLSYYYNAISKKPELHWHPVIDDDNHKFSTCPKIPIQWHHRPTITFYTNIITLSSAFRRTSLIIIYYCVETSLTNFTFKFRIQTIWSFERWTRNFNQMNSILLFEMTSYKNVVIF